MDREKQIEEDGAFAGAATNAMGGSSSTPATGAIDTVDPFLRQRGENNKKKLSSIVRRKPLKDIDR